jgi:hypothetical protein
LRCHGFREIVFVPLDDWSATVKELTGVEVAAVEAVDNVEAQPAQVRGLKPMEKAKIGMLRRYARLLCGLAGDEAGVGLSLTTPAANSIATAVAPQPIHKRKFKLSSVVDQGDDQEVDALVAGDFRNAVKKLRAANDGLEPTADEEATPDQLQGIAVKLAQDVVPFADFGVLRPHGQRLERALKFQANCWDPAKGELVAKELPGPPSIEEWLRSWKVFSFILVALGAVTRARLERYRDTIVALNSKFGQLRGCTWWIIAMADHRMRCERMEKLRRGMEADMAGGRGAGANDFDKTRPWDAVFLAAAGDTEFWNEEVKEAASRVKDRDELADPGHHVKPYGESRGVEQRHGSPEGDRGGARACEGPH